ncbi:Peroxisomal membrane protein PMP27 [Globomyces sp. JEL0801]|nr:Peroxisomal membrane protein PMP27 [Globomyces sp. JEL0801]
MSNLVAALACTRKTMRLGKQLDHARNISKSGSITDDILRVLTISKSFGLGLWLVHDALGWANTQKIIKLEAPKDVSRRGNQFWLFALVSSLMINVYKLRWNAIRLSQEQRILKANGTQAKDLSAADKIKALQVEKSNLVYATVSDSLDICIPSISLEYLPLEPGVAGLCGAITSLMAVWTQLKPLLK